MIKNKKERKTMNNTDVKLKLQFILFGYKDVITKNLALSLIKLIHASKNLLTKTIKN